MDDKCMPDSILRDFTWLSHLVLSFYCGKTLSHEM